MLTVRDERQPLLICEFEGKFTHDDAGDYERALSSIFRPGVSVGLAVTCTDVPFPEVAVLRRLGGWLRRNKANLAQHLVCTGIQVESAFLRGTMAFLDRVAPPPQAQRMFESRDEAIAWVIGQLGEAGLDVPG